MGGFEYISVMASIVAGLALTDLLTSLHRLIRTHRLVRWDWAAPIAALYAALTLIQVWWSLFDPDGGDMTIGEFLPQLVELVLMFLLCSSALPDETPNGGLDLRTYYDRNGPYFWSLYTAALAWPLLLAIVERLADGQGPWFLKDRLMDLVVLALFASLIFVRRRWWHAIAFVIMSLGPLGWLSRSLAG